MNRELSWEKKFVRKKNEMNPLKAKPWILVVSLSSTKRYSIAHSSKIVGRNTEFYPLNLQIVQAGQKCTHLSRIELVILNSQPVLAKLQKVLQFWKLKW